ncbi:MAG: hypothetical protein R3C03_04810 [Pirellulaceae bacterium]
MNSPNQETAMDSSADIEIEETIKQSTIFIGQWQNLISTTNWEKGQIIVQWRDELMSQELAASHYSDESWARMVGGVSPQHVGRLRRTYERFGESFTEYTGVYWSHFYAALDWDDAEMWLEGAVQNKWSVSQMRNQRWEAMGGDPNAKPNAKDIVDSEVEEELQSLSISDDPTSEKKPKEYTDEYVPGPRDEGPDFGDESNGGKSGGSDSAEDRIELTSEATSPAIQLFASFHDLPEDLDSASEAFKLCIIRHKADDWSEIPRDRVLALLDALKQLATTNFGD